MSFQSTQQIAYWLTIATAATTATALTNLATATPLVAQSLSQITNIKAIAGSDNLQIQLQMSGKDRPQVTYANQSSKSWVANLKGVNLRLTNGSGGFAQINPMPGIAAIEAVQQGANQVQVRVTAADSFTGKAKFKRQDSSDTIAFIIPNQAVAVKNSGRAIATRPELPVIAQAVSSNKPAAAPTVAVKPLFESKVTIIGADGKARAAQPPMQVAQQAPSSSIPARAIAPQSVKPRVPGRVQGVIPPSQRRPVPPPVGDISVSTTNLRPDIVDLGSNAKIAKLVLRGAPAIQVLQLIAREAGGLNVLAADQAGGTTGQTAGATGAAVTGVNRIIETVDIENESVQEAFNNILRITGLDANRIGKTVFVATKLPFQLKNVVSRTYRLNQTSVGNATAFLAGLGAERVVNRLRAIPGVQAAALGAGGNIVVNTTTESIPVLESVQPTANSILPLRGLQVFADENTNTVTLVGSPSLTEYAATQLARLDVRKRQVAVNVRIVEVNLNNSQNIGSSSSFGVGDSFFTVNNGVAVLNFGQVSPANTADGPTATNVPGRLTRPTADNPLAGAGLTVNPNGTELTRDPITGQFVNRSVNQPGVPAVGDPTQPFVSGVTQAARQAAAAVTGLDAAGTAGRPATYFLNPGGVLNRDLSGVSGNAAFRNGPFANTPILLDPATGQPQIATPGFAGTTPAGAGTNSDGNVTQNFLGTAAQLAYSLPSIFQYPQQFLSRLQATVATGNAKILTDPTLTVQEGETGSIDIGDQVVQGADATGRPIFATAGLNVQVQVNRVDENGFINMSVAPVVGIPGAPIAITTNSFSGSITPLTQRRVTSGQIRMRDGQTLILTGVIQDSDREVVTKVPFLGDLPIIGSLFRSTGSQNTRSETIIIVTPKIQDDSDTSNWGYTYQPSPEAQKILDNNRVPFR
ncbi:MAG: type II and III secretion system protein [Pseudanabaenaceae cyanobacterium bins.68]|nr:type II and III secretion system protein [Pseudanabaenaceae cyanobacterium bins.68]